MKPTSTYNMSKQAKRYLATARNPQHRSVMKKCFIDAELSALIKPKFKDRDFKEAPSE